MMSRILTFALFFVALTGCESNKRAGDITLANQATVSTPSSHQSPEMTGTTNLLTSSGAVNTSGATAELVSPQQSEKKSASDDSTEVSNSKIPARTLTIVRTKPDCKGADCPVIKVKRLFFTGRDRFNSFLDRTMASMVQMESNQAKTFDSFGEFAEYFWRTSKPRDEVIIEASVKRGDEDLVVVQLESYIYSGGAHGMSTTQYINWLPKTDRLLSLETMLLPNKMQAFQTVLKKQYDNWIKQNKDAISNPASYKKKWPFVENDNAALLKEGVAITYDPYAIAPYSFGRPTLIVPYKDLKGILRPELLAQ